MRELPASIAPQDWAEPGQAALASCWVPGSGSDPEHLCEQTSQWALCSLHNIKLLKIHPRAAAFHLREQKQGTA